MSNFFLGSVPGLSELSLGGSGVAAGGVDVAGVVGVVLFSVDLLSDLVPFLLLFLSLGVLSALRFLGLPQGIVLYLVNRS